MKVLLRANVRSLQELREELTGEHPRGVKTAFKLALGAAIHYWQQTYAPLHFSDAAYYRYGQPKAGWNLENRNSRKGLTLKVNGRSLQPPYSRKNILQARAGFPIDSSPMVYSGNTRAGITGPNFTTRGTANAVRGSWHDTRINWRALSARGEQLSRQIIYTNQQEISKMLDVIRSAFTAFCEIRNRRGHLPTLEELN